jgi:serine O-acetyltransferase
MTVHRHERGAMDDQSIWNLPDRITTAADYRAFVAADMLANRVKKWRFDSRWRHPVVHYLRLLRKVEYLQARQDPLSRVVRFWVRSRLQSQGVRLGFTVPPGVAGPGLSIAHYGTLVINTRARIGKFCRLHPGITIGISDGGVPVIGDLVYIGPNAVLYGAIHVGDGAAIGANSVVNRDVPSAVTVAGAPATVRAERDSSSLMPSGYPRRAVQ